MTDGIECNELIHVFPMQVARKDNKVRSNVVVERIRNRLKFRIRRQKVSRRN